MTCYSCGGPPGPRLLSAPAAAAVGARRSAAEQTGDVGTAFILGGGLLPDTLSALPPTFYTTTTTRFPRSHAHATSTVILAKTNKLMQIS